MNKKRLVLILPLLMLASVVFGVIDRGGEVFSQNAGNDVVRAQFWSGISGTGSATDPYLITNAEDLRYIEWASKGLNGMATRDFAGEHIRLTRNLDLTDFSVNEPTVGVGVEGGFAGIGGTTPFRGTFDGGGHTIIVAMRYERAVTAGGVFNIIENATIRNLTVAGHIVVETTANTSRIGGLFGEMRGILNLVENITIRASVREGAASVVSGSPRVGGLGGHAEIPFNNERGFRRIYSQMNNITIDAHVSSTKTDARVGGVLGQIKAGSSSLTSPIQYAPTRVMGVRLTNNASVSSGRYAGGIYGFVEQISYVIAADLNIANISIKGTEAGIISGHVGTSAKIATVNCNAHRSLDLMMIWYDHATHPTYLIGKATTFRFDPIPNARFRNIENGSLLDLRSHVSRRVKVHEEEINFNLVCEVRHTQDKSLTIDFNTKFIVQDSGTSRVAANLVYHDVAVYTQEFDVRVSLAWPEWAKISVIAVILIIGIACYQLFFLKKFTNVKTYFNGRKERKQSKRSNSDK
jgi:hypothetical protein